jgi:protein phosphatase
LLVGSGTHAGESGKHNEDRFTVRFFRDEADEPVTLAVVCDGIGGNRAGEVAADLAVQSIVATVSQWNGHDLRAIFTAAVNRASAEIAALSKTKLDYHGMSTTCAIALLRGSRLHTAYVGDSRLYLLRRDRLIQISIDHTWVQAALEHKLLTPTEAAQHPNRHVLLRYIGEKVKAKPDFRLRLPDDVSPEESENNQGLRLEPGEAVLVCSDGVSDVVNPRDIERCLATLLPQGAVDELIVLARRAGGPDNITAIVLRAPG